MVNFIKALPTIPPSVVIVTPTPPPVSFQSSMPPLVVAMSRSSEDVATPLLQVGLPEIPAKVTLIEVIYEQLKLLKLEIFAIMN